jgi:hypothetical protein
VCVCVCLTRKREKPSGFEVLLKILIDRASSCSTQLLIHGIEREGERERENVFISKEGWLAFKERGE